MDDFESFEYLNEKKYLYINFLFDSNTRTGSSSSIDSDNVSEGFSIEVESSIIYIDNGKLTDLQLKNLKTEISRRWHLYH